MTKLAFAVATLFIGTFSISAQTTNQTAQACNKNASQCQHEATSTPCKNNVTKQICGKTECADNTCNPQVCGKQNCNPKECGSQQCATQSCKTKQCSSKPCEQNQCASQSCGSSHASKGAGCNSSDNKCVSKRKMPSKSYNPFANLNLTESQKKALDKANETRKKAFDKAKSNYDKQLEKTLTPQQYKSYKENMEKRNELHKRAQRPEYPNGYLRPGKLEKAPEGLPLTGEPIPSVEAAD